MHRQDALVGHEVVHDREGALLDLAGVFGADDDDLHPLQMEEDRGPRSGAFGLRVGLERRDADDGEVRCERTQVFGGRAAEEVAGEDARPGRLGVDAQRAAVRRGRADEAVLGVQVATRAVGDEARAQPVVVGLADRPIDGTPPDLRVAGRLIDDELVLRRAPGVLAGPDDERSLGGDEALAVPDGVLVQLGSGEVRSDGAPERGTRPRRGGRGHRSGLLCAGDHGRIDRPRVTRARRLAGVGFRSRWCRDASTLRDGCGQIANGNHPAGWPRAADLLASAHNRRALIKSGRGTGPLKPRQPTDESARCQARAGPPAR